jgi:hypothetical protein
MMAGQIERAAADSPADAPALEQLLHGKDTWHVA